MKIRLFIITCIIFLAPIAVGGREGGGKRVDVRDDRLSVHVTNAPLFDVLKEIGDGTGMEVKVDPAVNKNVTVSFENVPMDRGIARLIHPLDYVLKWRRITVGEEPVDELTAVEIFRKGEREKAQRVLSTRHSLPTSKDVSREDLPPYQEDEDPYQEDEDPMPPPRPSRKKRPRSKYTGSITKVTTSDSIDSRGGTSGSPGHTRIRKFKVVADTASYDELSP